MRLGYTEERLLAFDLETGGLDPAHCGITEIAAVAYDIESGRRVGVMHSIVKAERGMRYEPRALDLQGRQFDDLAEGRDLLTVLQALAKLVRKMFGDPEKCVPFAHNSQFDMKFIGAACRRTGEPLPFSAQSHCTKAMFSEHSHLWGSSESNRLCHACPAVGVEFDEAQAHGALYDADRCAHLAMAIIRRLRG